jgi:hypothetical protein
MSHDERRIQIGMVDRRRYAIRFTGLNRTMALTGLTRRSCFVEVSATTVWVHMSWAFDSTIKRSSIVSVERDRDRVLGWGVHGWRGVWLVNGSSSQIVRIEIFPPEYARLMQLFRVKLRVLRVAVEQPGELIADLTTT